MRQKAQLACALIRPAAVLILDEPVVGLDPPSQALLHDCCSSASRRAGGLPHDPPAGFADGLADRAVLLSEGEVADAGPYAEVAGEAAASSWATG